MMPNSRGLIFSLLLTCAVSNAEPPQDLFLRTAVQGASGDINNIGILSQGGLSQAPSGTGSLGTIKYFSRGPGFQYSIYGASGYTSYCQSGGQVFCSGNIRAIATARHCFDNFVSDYSGNSSITIATAQLGTVNARIYAPGSGSNGFCPTDLALLLYKTEKTCSETDIPTIGIKTELGPGELVQWQNPQEGIACGVTNRSRYSSAQLLDVTVSEVDGTVYRGECSAENSPKRDPYGRELASHGIIEGNSGGGLYSDGQLAGILSFKAPVAQGYRSTTGIYTTNGPMHWMKNQVAMFAQKFGVSESVQSNAVASIGSERPPVQMPRFTSPQNPAQQHAPAVQPLRIDRTLLMFGVATSRPTM